MYLFYLGGVQLPIAPSKLQVKINGNNKTITLINEGEVNLIKPPGLSDISFDVLLPNVKYPFASYTDGFKEAEYYLGMLKLLKTSNKPFEFSVSRILPSGNHLFKTIFTATIEDYTITEDADKYGSDVWVSIKLKEYKGYETQKLNITKKSINSSGSGGVNKTVSKTTATIEKNRGSDKTLAKTHTVKSGETLWAICKKELNDGSKYKEIASLNGINNPNLIHVGQVIKLG